MGSPLRSAPDDPRAPWELPACAYTPPDVPFVYIAGLPCACLIWSGIERSKKAVFRANASRRLFKWGAGASDFWFLATAPPVSCVCAILLERPGFMSRNDVPLAAPTPITSYGWEVHSARMR